MPQNAEEGLIKGQKKRFFLILHYTFFRDQPLMFYVPTFIFSLHIVFNNHATFVNIRLLSKETKINFLNLISYESFRIEAFVIISYPLCRHDNCY